MGPRLRTALLVVLLSGFAAAVPSPAVTPAFAAARAAPGTAVGTIVTILGRGVIQEGEIAYSRPRVGQRVEVDRGGDYDGEEVAPLKIAWKENTARLLHANDPIRVGDILQTMDDGYVKILFQDDSILDVGPNSVVELQTYVGPPLDPVVQLRLAYGHVRGLVPHKVNHSQNYRVDTPAAIVGIRRTLTRGLEPPTEFIVSASTDEELARTDAVCVRGEMSNDIAKINHQGLVFYHPVVLTPGFELKVRGPRGFAEPATVQPISQAALEQKFLVIGRLAGAAPEPKRLPGTVEEVERVRTLKRLKRVPDAACPDGPVVGKWREC